jgi:HEAT repeat protein
MFFLARRIAYHTRRLNSPHATFPREASIRALVRAGTPAAWHALLSRLARSIAWFARDEAERALIVAAAREHPAGAVPVLRRILREGPLGHPTLELLRALIPAEDYLASVIDALHARDERSSAAADIVVLIDALEHARSPRAVEALLARLGSGDEDVRVAAVHSLAARGDPQVVPALVRTLLSADSIRTRASVAEALADAGLPIESALCDALAIALAELPGGSWTLKCDAVGDAPGGFRAAPCYRVARE